MKARSPKGRPKTGGRYVRVLRNVALALLGAAAAGCATVKPYEMEHLADPVMMLANEGREDDRELKWLEAREGSTGGATGAGGGCACN